MRAMRSLSVHPAPASSSSDAAQPAVTAPVPHYRAVPCRPLAAFDPIPVVKCSLFSRAVVKGYDACFRRTRVVLVPLYCVGLFLRLASNFSPAAATDVLAVTSAVCLTPLCFIAFLDMRRDLVLVLLKSFDFWFLGATSLLWTVAIGAAMGPSARLATLPALWMEVIIGVLMDSCIAVRAGFALVSVGVLVSILTLMLGISLDLTSGLDYYESIFVIAPTHFALSLRDVILNTMATMAVFYARVMFLSIRGIRRRRRDPTDTRVHSILVRCALRWETGQVSKGAEQELRCVDSAGILSQTRSRVGVHRDSSTATTTAKSTMIPSTITTSFPDQPRLLQMTPVANPDLDVLVATDTVFRKAPALTLRLQRVLPVALMALGAIGVVGTVIGLMAELEAPHRDSRPVPSPVTTIDIVSTIALASTTVYSAVIFASYQRQFLRHTVATFNFIFLSIQLSVAHICLCDVFYWQRHKMLSVIASWTWMHVLLTADALTPAMKERLGFKVWCMLPIIVLAIAGQAMLGIELVWRDRWKLQNRVVWAMEMHEGRRVEFHSASVLLGRLVTLVVWFLRLLYRVCRRSSDDELILLQGGA